MKSLPCLALLTVLCPAVALATEVAGASPRSMVVELKFSPYVPNLATTSAYSTIYGNGPMLLGELEFDYQFFQKFGSLGVSASVGYAEKFGKALAADGVTRSNQTSGIRVVPLKAQLVYRFDWLNQRFDIPLVPYLKGGAVLIPWWITKGGDVEVVGGQRAAGYKFGLAGVAGLALALDFLDKRLSRDFDTSMGVNHTYLFAEFTYQNMTVFEFNASAAPLDLTSSHWMFGLALEF
jgi:hypothetical protein